MSLCLSIDSSGRGGRALLAESHGGAEISVLARAEHDLARGNAETLFALFDQLFEEAGRRREEIDRVAVVQGPGSFTGLRIGIMTAKGLSYALGCQLWSAPSLPLLRADSVEPSLALVAAGRGFAFVDFGDPSSPSQSSPARLDASGIAQLAHGQSTFQLRHSTTDHAAAELLEDPLLAECVGVPVETTESLARLALLEEAPAARSEPAALLPVYLSPSQAERTHGVDLAEAVHRPEPPESWG